MRIADIRARIGGPPAGAGSATPDAAASEPASMLDLSGDGDPLDDSRRMTGKAMR